ncbi:nedd8-conjugating enzyme UbcE2M-like [Apostichopus japonicus]|uniref:nedd8-conjugating enzyme UbcE2M-like n=1 Tax=Stichopus japonicus TaxID=307972 RepID=UPI003AB1EB91
MGVLSVAKDFQNLVKNISSFSDGQASVCYYTDDMSLIKVLIGPTGGLYKDGEFIFSIKPDLLRPDQAPDVRCLTQIYHPNIDTIEDDGDLCLNLFEEWQSHFSLQDVVQGLLFLLYNPNLEDALCPIFSPDMTMEEFTTNVKRSLNGEAIEGYHFPKNQTKPRPEADRTDTDCNGSTEYSKEVSFESGKFGNNYKQIAKSVMSSAEPQMTKNIANVNMFEDGLTLSTAKR